MTDEQAENEGGAVVAARALFVDSTPATDQQGERRVILTFCERADPTRTQSLALTMRYAAELVVSVLVDLQHLGDGAAAEMLGRFLEEE